MVKSSFKRLELAQTTNLENVGALLLQCQHTPEQQNDFSYTVEGAFYPVCPLKQA